MNTPPGKGAFTLIELLVVVGIIALLVALLVPTLSEARQLTRRTTCLTHLKGLSDACHLYLSVNGDTFPIAKYTPKVRTEYTYVSWDFRYRADGTLEPGLLWTGQTNPAILQCPSFTGEANWAGDENTGYNYNTSYIGHGEYESVFAPARLQQITAPDRCALFGDGEYAGGANKYMRAPLSGPGDAQFTGRYAGTQGYRHLETTNVIYCDGSAASREQRYTTIQPSYHADQIAPGTGFLSADNSQYDLE